MALTGVDFTSWAERLAAGYEVARREGRVLGDEDGPFRQPLRLLNGGIWTGVAGDHFRELLIRLGRQQLDPLVDHLACMASALERLHDEVSVAVQAEGMGTCLAQVPDIAA